MTGCIKQYVDYVNLDRTKVNPAMLGFISFHFERNHIFEVLYQHKQLSFITIATIN